MAADHLSAARLRELLHYDPETGIFTRRVSVRQFKADEVAGFRYGGKNGQRSYVAVKVDQRIYFAHRLAWLYVRGEWPQHQIDHINGDRTDNRIANLRDVTPTMNNQNMRRSCGGVTGLLGVSPADGKFRATIKYGGKQVLIGRYDTPEEAHAAYLEAKRQHHPGCTI